MYRYRYVKALRNSRPGLQWHAGHRCSLTAHSVARIATSHESASNRIIIIRLHVTAAYGVYAASFLGCHLPHLITCQSRSSEWSLPSLQLPPCSPLRPTGSDRRARRSRAAEVYRLQAPGLMRRRGPGGGDHGCIHTEFTLVLAFILVLLGCPVKQREPPPPSGLPSLRHAVPN